jgi:hypothetical protein
MAIEQMKGKRLPTDERFAEKSKAVLAGGIGDSP